MLDGAAGSFLGNFLHVAKRVSDRQLKRVGVSFLVENADSPRTGREIVLCCSCKSSERTTGFTNLRDALSVLSSVESGPGYPTRILPLKEQRFCLAVLKSENFAIAADVELALLRNEESIQSA